MPAKDYSIMCAGLTGNIFLGKKSKRDPNVMLDDRRQLPEKEFIDAVIYWAVSKMSADGDTMQIRTGGEVVAEIQVNRKKLNL